MDCSSRGRNVLFNNIPHSQGGVTEGREQRWADGSSRGAVTANTLNAFLRGRWGGPAAKQTSLVAYIEPLLNHRKQLVQQHLSTSGWFRLSTHKSTRQDGMSTLEPEAHCTQLRRDRLFLHNHPKQVSRKCTCLWSCNRQLHPDNSRGIKALPRKCH